MKRVITLLLACLILLTGCSSRQEYNGEPIELWLVTEETDPTGMNQQAEILMDRFRELYPNVTIRMDILPRKEESRTAYLKKIRSEIMGGGGPDMYLLPTAPQSYPKEESVSTPYMEPLFGNVGMQMYNGIFTDISEYYDADETLGKEGLVTGVMDVGVMADERYLLPLRYKYDVLAVNADAFDDTSIFEGGITDLYDLALKMKDYRAAHAVSIAPSVGLVSDFVDYETGNVLMDARELAELFERYQKVLILADEENHQDVGYYVAVASGGELFVPTEEAYPGYNCDIDSYIYEFDRKERIFTTNGYPFLPLELEDVIDAAAAIKMQEANVAMYPIRAADGSLVAEITYYGAVGSGCEHPEIAYEFLRMFYSQEMQWEQYYPRNTGLNLGGLVEEGFPVRTIGLAEPFFEAIRARLQAKDDAYPENDPYFGRPRLRKFLKEDFTITDADVTILTTHVDEARFPVTSADGNFFGPYIAQLIDHGDPTEIAEAMIHELMWLLSEG